MSDEIDYEQLRQGLAEFSDAERVALDRLGAALTELGPIDDGDVDVEAVWRLIQQGLGDTPGAR